MTRVTPAPTSGKHQDLITFGPIYKLNLNHHVPSLCPGSEDAVDWNFPHASLHSFALRHARS